MQADMRFTEQEMAELEAMAKIEGLTGSDYVRELVGRGVELDEVLEQEKRLRGRR
jgi:hypothetical protein